MATGGLVKVHTEIGYFVLPAWVTEGLKPGILACSHHLGRWRLQEQAGIERYNSALVDLRELEPGRWRLRQLQGVTPYPSADPDTQRIWWSSSGVNQNLTFPVHPDPVSGMQCWHQVVRAEKAGGDDREGDVYVDTHRAARRVSEVERLCPPRPRSRRSASSLVVRPCRSTRPGRLLHERRPRAGVLMHQE